MTQTTTIEEAPELDTVDLSQRLRKAIIHAVRQRGEEKTVGTALGTLAIMCSLAGVFAFTLRYPTQSDARAVAKVWKQALACLPAEHQQKWPRPAKSTNESGAGAYRIEYRPPPPTIKG